jgi:hypothetical protein
MRKANSLLANCKEDLIFLEKSRMLEIEVIYMQKFAEEYPDMEFVQQVAAKLPWFHLVTIFILLSN